MLMISWHSWQWANLVYGRAFVASLHFSLPYVYVFLYWLLCICCCWVLCRTSNMVSSQAWRIVLSLSLRSYILPPTVFGYQVSSCRGSVWKIWYLSILPFSLQCALVKSETSVRTKSTKSYNIPNFINGLQISMLFTLIHYVDIFKSIAWQLFVISLSSWYST